MFRRIQRWLKRWRGATPVDEQLVEGTGAIAGELLEVGLDQLLDEGVLRDVPVLGPLISMLKLKQTVSDRILFKKVEAFVLETGEISSEARERFMSEHFAGSSQEEEIGEVVINVLDHLADAQIARIFARVWRRFVLGEIHRVEFEVLASIVNGLNPYLVRQMKQIYAYDGVAIFDVLAAKQLAALGLMDEDLKDVGGGVALPRGKLSIVASENGKRFYNVYMKEPETSEPT